MGVGVAGAMTDVSTDVDLNAGIDRTWGRDDEFRDTRPGTFSYVLDNATGKYTPGNVSSSLSTTVTEGMQVCWQLGTRLVAGTVRGIEPMFPGSESAWAQVRITCDDMLGSMSRNQVTLTARAMVLGARPYLYWPFNEPVGSSISVEQSGNLQPSFDSSYYFGITPTFGVAAIPAIGETQASAPNSNFIFPTTGYQPFGGTWPATNKFTTINYATNSMGTWGIWMTATGANPALQVFVYCAGFAHSFRFGIDQTGAYSVTMGSAVLTSSVPVVTNVPAYLQLVVTNSGSTSITGEFFINGVSQGTVVWVGLAPDGNGLSSNAARTPQGVLVAPQAGAPAGAPTVFSHLSHTPSRVNEYLLNNTEAGLIAAAVGTTSEASLGTLPTALSASPVSGAGLSGTALDILNAVIHTEQGYVYTSTTGTLTAPAQVVKVRERTRGATADYTFDTITELSGAVPFVRDSTNIVSTLTTTGPTLSVVLQDTTVQARVGSASTTESILNTQYVDVLGWGQDRLQLGKNANLRVQSVTVDAMTTNTDRSAALLAINPGDHIQITSNPVTQLGFSTWDGWLLGATEHHSVDHHTFEMRLAPVLPATAIYDTNRYMADGALTLSAGINAAVASMSVATTGPKLETVQVPYDLLLDTEQVTVTACNSATPQVATITRAVNGTVAASHTTSATIELATPSLYAF